MRIGLHDAEKSHMKNKTFPNYALMKISAYHKQLGDQVEWWNPLYHYDRVYSSKIFDFTPEDPYLPDCTIKGGTGYRDIPLNYDLLEYLVKTYTNPGETVLDNCMGAGSTGVACLNTGREFVGIELDPEYYQIAKERIDQHVENIF